MTADEVVAACVGIIRRHAGAACGRIVLFGSRARGEAQAGSDIDLGIETDRPLPRHVMARIRADVDELRTLYSVDVIDLRSVSVSLRGAVLRDGRVVYQPAAAA